MNKKGLDYAISLIRTKMNEDVSPGAPTNSISSEISGLMKNPPVDLRNRKYKRLPILYKDLFRRKRNV